MKKIFILDVITASLLILIDFCDNCLPQTSERIDELNSKPNIILIVADDVGWNDVGWNNRAVKTPNLESLLENGVRLTSSYVSPVCSPSRASILTGIYSFKLGLQHGVLRNMKPHGLPLHLPTIADRLRSLGYSTNAIGKWHLGFCNWSYTPTRRGFDTFYGFYTGQQDYYNHMTGGVKGFDFRINDDLHRHSKRKYSTIEYGNYVSNLIENHEPSVPLFLYLAFQAGHTPLQVPEKYEKLYEKMKNKKRRKFSAMITAMDDAIGFIMTTLRKKKIFRNTIFIFISDNGASPESGGSNWPLRGGKSTVWEGGTKVPTFVSSKLLRDVPRDFDGLMHAVDWFPTILDMADGISEQNIDGLSQWDSILNNAPPKRNSFIYNINSLTGQHAYRQGEYKLIDGSAGYYSGWYPMAWDEQPNNVNYLFKKVN